MISTRRGGEFDPLNVQKRRVTVTASGLGSN